MAKSKSSSEVEYLRGVIKALKKQIKRNEKRQHLYEDLEEKETEVLMREELDARTKSENKVRCPKCAGKLNIIDGIKFNIYVCQDCNYRYSKRMS